MASRGVKLNAGSRWIRNASGGEGVWGTQKQQSASSTCHGGHQGDARFMEVDGRIREIGGEVGDILIKSRDLRAQQIGDKGGLNGKQVIDEVVDKDKDSDTEKVVIDPKRKRMEDIVFGENNGLDIMQINEKYQKDGSTNLLLAGPGVQARQAS
ncbi:hypothetical protein POM88_047329 [Heracleum sosnowskyi]|uniref:Uncharacterized protein n=1 Tax=Heracleum sosnowskyi TaxID=360622 RepID=A0AAD8GU46_9APIA|nr:hypothetical protein POM88_047329 [Heracleum sosnowskyi]